jgi:hypothetical protein
MLSILPRRRGRGIPRRAQASRRASNARRASGKGLHLRRQRLARSLASGAEPAPHVEDMLEAGGVPAGVSGLSADLFRYRGETARRHPDAKPTIAQEARAARRRVRLSDRPPTTNGIGGDGAGTIRASSREKNLPSKLTGAPRNSARTIARHSPIRCPRVAGSTPQISSSCRSSPPMPTPNVSRPGRELGDGRKLTRHRHRMTQRQQVQRHIAGQFRTPGQQ